MSEYLDLEAAEEAVARWIYLWRWPDDPEAKEFGEQYLRLGDRLLADTGIAQALLALEERVRGFERHVEREIEPMLLARAEQAEARLGRAAEEWRLVERYCESFKDDDFRLVFKKGEAVLEISVGKEVYDSFSSVAVLVEQEKEQR